MNGKRPIHRGILYFTLLLAAQTAWGQSRIESIDISRFPTVELRVTITKPASTGKLTVSNVQLAENGVPQRVEFFECPEDSIRLSIAVLLDRSASMARIGDRPDRDSTKLREAKLAIGTFLELLGPRDEAALFSFTTQNFTLRPIFTVEHDFSFDHASIKRALVPIVANGGTRLWQAIMDAVDLLKTRAGRRILIVLTDGRNQLGESYRTQAIQAAVSAGIPVYPIGLGNDVDVGALSGLAGATGGRYYYAPEASDLTDVFNTIAGTLLTDGCVLRYTSSNPCLDGSTRVLDLNASGPGFFAETDSFYVVPLQLSPVTLSIQPGLSAIARETLNVPLNVQEQFSTLSPLSYSMTIGYDVDLMRFVDVVTAGTMSEGFIVDVDEDVPGTLRLLRMDFYPFFPTGTLCELVFDCLPGVSDTRSAIRILDAEVRGLCPTALTTRDGEVGILACEDEFIVGDSLRVLLSGSGGSVLVPLRTLTSAPEGAPITATLRIDHSGLPYEIVGIETRGTLCESGGVVMQEIAPGVKEFAVQAVSSGIDTVLFFLRVQVREVTRGSSYNRLPITELDIESECRVAVRQAEGGSWAIVLIDGICEPLLRRRNTASVGSHPNPFHPATTVQFRMPVDGHALLRIMDTNGRIVATLLDGQLREGDYVHRFDGRALPAGEYYAVLLTDGGQAVHRMLLLK